ncbi:NAD(P)/FAD-dependent oxidoreductase [Marinigracilibium pacificum]|uniref:FAD-dependent oxidoreductase n=1 Tax=Marinigracilibium pacificum TaxID=2729599 RepID=A0A848J3S1_9BACT|nr:FAD-dependent oxidoreductase [Marinigracilibium pacificum]NMM50376.1 FAD-dependent oxidoreductase [Marinigracilibium pacificum]
MKKVAIVGGGVVGLCSAYYLNALGYEVSVISDDLEKKGCSYGNAGMIVPSHFIPLAAPGVILMGLKWMLRPDSPFHIHPRLNSDLISWGLKFYKASTAKHVENSKSVLSNLNLSSRELYLDIQEKENIDFSLKTKGLFMLCKTKKGLEEETHVARLSNKLGIPAEVLSPRELMEIDKNVELDVEGGVYFPLDACFNPTLFMNQMHLVLQQKGVKFISDKVESININGNKVTSLETTHQEIIADEFIIAAGIWSTNLLQSLEVNIPMQGGKGYSVMVENPATKPEICSLLCEARVSVTPMGDSIRFGGTMELNGTDMSISHQRLAGIFKSIPQYYPQFKEKDFLSAPTWVGLRPCSPDGLPYIGRFKNYTNLTAATGHAMMGMSLGPITGKLISQIIAGHKTNIDISQLNPNRYN